MANYRDANTPICRYIRDINGHFDASLIRAKQRMGPNMTDDQILDLIETVLSQPNHITRSRNAMVVNWIYFRSAQPQDLKVILSHSTKPPQYVTCFNS
jgi:hypothetical protein